MSEIDRIISDVELQRGSMCTIPKHEFWALIAHARDAAKTEADLIARLERAEEALKPFAALGELVIATGVRVDGLDALKNAADFLKSNPI